MIEIKQYPAEETKREPLFAVVDDTGSEHVRTEHDHPVTYPPAVGLSYIHLARTRGEGPALDWLLMWALGPEGHAALRGALGMTDQQVGEITDAVVSRALGRDQSAPKP